MGVIITISDDRNGDVMVREVVQVEEEEDVDRCILKAIKEARKVGLEISGWTLRVSKL